MEIKSPADVNIGETGSHFDLLPFKFSIDIELGSGADNHLHDFAEIIPLRRNRPKGKDFVSIA